MNVYYHSWGQYSSLFPTASSRIAGPDQPSFPSMTQRVARDNISIPRSGSVVHPSVVDHGTNDRVGISVAALNPLGNSQGVHIPLLPSVRRSNGHMNMTQVEDIGASVPSKRRGSIIQVDTIQISRISPLNPEYL